MSPYCGYHFKSLELSPEKGKDFNICSKIPSVLLKFMNNEKAKEGHNRNVFYYYYILITLFHGKYLSVILLQFALRNFRHA